VTVATATLARRLERREVADLLGSNDEPLARLLDSLGDHDEIEAAKRSRRHVEDQGRILATLESRRATASQGQRYAAPGESARVRA
jgi:hypothetical protein